jgi:hypothetical protein
MSDNTIYIAELFDSQSLVTRQAARDLFNKISTTTASNISLDFSMINFASRSFFDELNNSQSKLKLLGKQVEFQNLNDVLSSLLQIVKSTANSRSSILYTSTANAQVLAF